MAVVDQVLWALVCAVTGSTLTAVWLMTIGGYRRQQATRIVPVARKIDGRVVSKYSRAERRAHKRRHHG